MEVEPSGVQVHAEEICNSYNFQLMDDVEGFTRVEFFWRATSNFAIVAAFEKFD